MRKSFTTLMLLLAAGSLSAATPPSAGLPAPPPGQGLDYAALDQAKLANEDASAERAGLPP